MADNDTIAETSQTVNQEDGDDTALAGNGMEVAAAPERKVKKIIRKKRRPARTQVDPSFISSEPPPQTGTIFNIW
jgi:hypothetical protein